MSEQILQAMRDGILEGNVQSVQQSVQQALDAGLAADLILKQGLIAAMDEVGRRYEAGEYFVPEMLVAARAMKEGLALLRPHLVEAQVQATGRVVIGTVMGDLHDIGKNLVSLMLEGAGFEIHDLGTNVSPEQFVEAVRQVKPDIVGMSALLTTTMVRMKDTIAALEQAGLRGQVKVIIGGAPVTASYAESIGADGYGADASQAVALAKSLVK